MVLHLKHHLMIFMQTNGRGPLLVLRRSLRWHWLHRLPLHLLHRYCVLSRRPNHPHAGLPIQGARSKPHAEVGSTSLMCGPAAELGRANGINSTGIPRCRSWGMRRRLQVIPCDIPVVPRPRKPPMQEGMAHITTATYLRRCAAALAPYVAAS